jgi:hypothetical protein
MIAHNSKIIGEGLTYDDVLLYLTTLMCFPWSKYQIKIFKKYNA